MVDTFAGDAVPMHLLTEESMELYLRVLARGGAAGLLAVRIDHEPPAGGAGVRSSRMVLARPGTLLPPERRAPGTPSAGSPVLWTDDFGNILAVLRVR